MTKDKDMSKRPQGLNEATGQFRIGDITLQIRDGGVAVQHRERVVTNVEHKLEGLLYEEFFAEDADNKKGEKKSDQRKS